MSEIAKCPICGEDPVVLDHYGGRYEKSYICCNVEVHGLSLWNQYAAAMKLARLTVAMKTCRAYCPETAYLQAQDCVLEVFK